MKHINHFARLIGLTTAVALAACGGGGSDSTASGSTGTGTPTSGTSPAPDNNPTPGTGQTPPPPAAPSAVTGLSVTAGDAQATLAWHAAPGALAYGVYSATQGGLTPFNYTALTDGRKRVSPTNAYLATGLVNGKAYCFVVTGIDISAEGAQSNEVCVTPSAAVGGGDAGTPPEQPPQLPPGTPPESPPGTPPGPPPATNSDYCVVPTPGFSGSYRSSAMPDVAIRTVTTGSTLAPQEITTFTSDGVRTETATQLKVTLTASGGPQLTRESVRTEITGSGLHLLQEYSAGQALSLPMKPGDSQTTGGALSGTTAQELGPYSCSGTLSGSQVVTYTFVGLEPVSVPAGRFAACRFAVTQVSNIKTTCNQNHGSGSNTDTTALWVLDGFIVKSIGGDGSVTELMSYTR